MPKVADSLSPDRAARGFLQQAADPARYGYQTLDPFESAGIMVGWVPTGARVLDVGCGTGSLSSLIREHCQAEVVGVEPDPARVEMARACGLRVHAGVLELGLRQELGEFDVVVFGDVLEHLSDPYEVLTTALGFLKAGGLVLISVPNVAHWTMRQNLLRGRFNYESSGIMDATHLRWFTQRTLVALCESVGLQVEAREVSAGVWLAPYRYHKPWKWFKQERVIRLVRWASKRWPLLFGCQHVVKARKPLRSVADS